MVGWLVGWFVGLGESGGGSITDRDRPASDVQVCPARLAFSLRLRIRFRENREEGREKKGYRLERREKQCSRRKVDPFHGNRLILGPKVSNDSVGINVTFLGILITDRNYYP